MRAASVVLNACGGREPGSGSTPMGPAPPSNPAPPAAPVIASGPNWSFRVPGFEGVYIIGSLGRGDRLTALEASFDASSSPITAVLNPFGSCFNIDADRARFTGTRSGNTVQLQSEPVNGQVIHLEGTVSSAGDAFDGVYSITGGCGNGASAPIRGRPVNLAGVYVGVMGRIPSP